MPDKPRQSPPRSPSISVRNRYISRGVSIHRRGSPIGLGRREGGRAPDKSACEPRSGATKPASSSTTGRRLPRRLQSARLPGHPGTSTHDTRLPRFQKRLRRDWDVATRLPPRRRRASAHPFVQPQQLRARLTAYTMPPCRRIIGFVPPSAYANAYGKGKAWVHEHNGWRRESSSGRGLAKSSRVEI